jgi:hypothetical protein
MIQATPWSSFHLSNNHIRAQRESYISEEEGARRTSIAKPLEHGMTNMHTGTDEDCMDEMPGYFE